jgi:hypothetical protein
LEKQHNTRLIIEIWIDGKLLLMDTAPEIIRRKREALLLENEGNYRKKFRAECMVDSANRGM